MHKPLLGSNGHVYVPYLKVNTAGVDYFGFTKATDPENGSWSDLLDESNCPSYLEGYRNIVSVYQDGDDMFLALIGRATVDDILMFKVLWFDASTDTVVHKWQIYYQTGNGSPLYNSVSIAGIDKTNNYLIVEYTGFNDNVMGDSKLRVDYCRLLLSSPYTIVTNAAVDDGGDSHYWKVAATRHTPASTDDEFQLGYHRTDSTTEDPPTSSNNVGYVHWKHYDSSTGTLDAANSAEFTYFLSVYNQHPMHPMAWVDGSNHYIGMMRGIAGVDTAFMRYHVNPTTDDVDFNDAYWMNSSDSYRLTTSTGTGQVYCDQVRDPDTGYLYAVFHNSVDTDFWMAESQTQGSNLSWTMTKLRTSTENSGQIACNIYTRGGNKVLAFVTVENGVPKYDEYVLSAGSTSASGTPSIENITSAGSAKLGRKASGSPTLDAITSAGNATAKKFASGSPTIANITSTGVSDTFTVHTASGTPTIQNITSTGASDAYAIRYASGTPSIENVTSTGSAKLGRKASGSPSIENLTSTGVSSAFTTHTASGTPTIEPLTSTGSAKLGRKASGTPSIENITSTGVSSAFTAHTASGTPSIDNITSTGSSKLGRKASGTPSIENITSTGVATRSGNVFSSGTPSIENLTSAGTATTRKTASGSPTIDTLTSTGSATKVRTASGSPTIENITSTGVASAFTVLSASGTPTIENLTSTGSAKFERTASGSPTIENITSTGVASAFTVISASGTPTIEAITSTGSATIRHEASGSPTIENITSTGSAKFEFTASGSPSIANLTSAGNATRTSVKVTDVNTTESWNDGDTGIVITGTGFV